MIASIMAVLRALMPGRPCCRPALGAVRLRCLRAPSCKALHIRALADWLEWQLRQVRGRIRELEIKEQQEQQRREQAHAALRWKIQPQRSSSMALVHRRDCALYPVEGGFLNREEAVIALAEPDIEACQICKPETGLVDG
ncbi:DUF6233 domain-containing protein [Streptomyces sp. NBC_01591]|uniref:DUF6233 domain-containing protein n=1 Tax=Streptomyces sp. NBC_01591 TaxID=2975888 RepID=UPI002DD937C7|nr:DUF6233 domain-containing protein [Streptomyces sp. NBC_01591]WSD66205.1 DUF6233 domain-containing protein [Streptomyces sp. NBC_01591]